MSHREYLARLAWDAEQWNRPSRTDYYLMRLIQVISCSRADLETFRIPFETELSTGRENRELSQEAKVALSKSKWRARIQQG